MIIVAHPRCVLHSSITRGTPGVVLVVGSQNPGRVVTLIHKEDWDRFSRSVSSFLLIFAGLPQIHYIGCIPG